MKRTKPGKRTAMPQVSENHKRKLRSSLPDVSTRKDLQGRASYGAYAKHKEHPAAYRLKPYEGTEERTYCDAHASFMPNDIVRIPDLLAKATLAGAWSENETLGDPTMLWTIDDNGWIYELRITRPGSAEYHGYPLLPTDAFAHKIIQHYENWLNVDAAAILTINGNLPDAIALARKKYR